MSFLREIIDESDGRKRTAMLSGKDNTRKAANRLLSMLSRESGIPPEALMIAVTKEIVFSCEGILLGMQYPGDPDSDTRAHKIVETLVRKRAMIPKENRDVFVETVFPGSASIIQSAINAGVTRVSAERSILKLVYSGRYVTLPGGEVLPVDHPDAIASRKKRGVA